MARSINREKMERVISTDSTRRAHQGCMVNLPSSVALPSTVAVTSQVPVKEVAYRLGFSDHSYFIRLFRQTVGISPQEYRKRNGRG